MLRKEWQAKLSAGDQFVVALPRAEVIRRFGQAGWLGESRKKLGTLGSTGAAVGGVAGGAVGGLVTGFVPATLKNRGVETPEGLLLEWRSLIGLKATDINIRVSESGASTLIDIKYSYTKGNNDVLNGCIQVFEAELRYLFQDVMVNVNMQ